MNLNATTKISKNTFSTTALIIMAIAVLMGGVSTLLSHRQYSPAKIEGTDDDMGAKGMAQFFFNARKNINTNAMDYSSMLAADIADRAMSIAGKNHRLKITTPGLSFAWNSMGPTNIGGRTRAILIDNTDPTHQTLFAGGVSGGIWKSTNGGATWDATTAALVNSLNDTLSNINVCSIAQDSKGAIYIGTGEGFSIGGGGEGFSNGILGGGIFKSTNDGATWRLLSSTKPSTANSTFVTWAYVNRIAIRPDSFQVIYAATNAGLMVSHDSGATWSYAVNSATKATLNKNSLDVKISTDGSVVMAFSGGYGFYCYPQAANSNLFTQIKSSGAGHLNGNASRIEFAISSTDPNRIYASEIDANGVFFGSTGTASGIFMTTTGKTNGGYWYEIGPGGTSALDPYAEPTSPITDDQGTYDNTLGVPPGNEAQVLCGGTTLWEWSGNSSTDTIGSWQKVDHYFPYYPGDPLWVHPDMHTIVFDQNNPETVYIGCDGGIFKCTNLQINPSSQEASIANLDFQPINRNYNVTQYYSICYSPEVNTANQLGLGGGTQDNGSPYINGNTPNYPYDATDMTGGDGSGSVISSLNSNIAYFCGDNGTLVREGNLGALTSPTLAYTNTQGLRIGGDIDSVWQAAAGSGAACFVFPVALYENPYDTLNHDSLQFTATKNYNKGDTIWPQAANGPITYPYVLTKAVASGKTITVPDRVVSRLAIGFTGKTGGIWINGQGASINQVVWMPIAGTLSTPTSYNSTTPVHCLAWGPDGDALYAGSEGGVLFRFTNINSIIATKYKTGALWSKVPGKGIADTSNQVISTNITFSGLSGRDILSIAVNPNDKNNMLVTVGNYGQTTYVYYTDSALGLNPAFTSVQGNLPAMPVYSSILGVLDSTGKEIPNSAMIATEHGIYTTSNINAGAGTTWTKTNSTGLPNVLTLAIKQQTAPPWLCNNADVIYAGTHGRGVWASGTNHAKITSVPTITTAGTIDKLLLFPNPMTNQGNIQYTLASADNVTVAIYDINGREVKTINVGQQSPGSHLVTFESAGLSAGTYFASLTGSNFRKVAKFIVIK